VFDYPDHTLWEINHYNGAVNQLLQMPWVPDSVAIGYCPTNGLVYQTGGDGAYRDNPLQTVHDQDGVPVPGGELEVIAMDGRRIAALRVHRATGATPQRESARK
jgi:hypothetical protein